jgi:hypothetical protein
MTSLMRHHDLRRHTSENFVILAPQIIARQWLTFNEKSSGYGLGLTDGATTCPALGTRAYADDPVPIIRTLCVPRISLFELETFGLWDVPRNASKALSNLYT